MKKIKRLFSVSLIVFVTFLSMSFISCKSTEEKLVTEIHTVEEFFEYANSIKIKEKSNGKNIVGSLRLMEDLDFSGINYEPVELKMAFDGNGHSLNNITINEYEEYKKGGVGVFISNHYKKNGCYYEDASYNLAIKNLSINNLTINFTGKDTPVGGLMGEYGGRWRECKANEKVENPIIYNNGRIVQNLTTLENIKINGKINAPQAHYVGGMMGKACGSGIVKNCEIDVEIVGGDYVGGLAGTSTIEDVRSEVEFRNCTNKGNVVGKSYVGGISGLNTKIYDCTNTGNITGGFNVGGIVGYSKGNIENCLNEGNVIGTSCGQNSYADIGGIVGCDEGDKDGIIIGCINKGSVSSGYHRVGGIAGYANRGLSNCKNEGNINGNECVGGVIGWWTGNGALTKCENSGNITATIEAGGIVGGISATNTVRLMNCKNMGDITANNRVGGLVGASFAILDTDYLITCSNTGILNCDGQKNETYNKLTP